ncbi:MAG: hypothetical protein JKY65_16540 [Planctomycetes bacterium]|nr:hypothetical protein [Planctomycetota bacterium]
MLEEAAAQLGELLDELVLVGGCAAGLLVTDPGSSPIRPTEDVDLVVEATTYIDYQRFGKRLANRGFKPGTTPGDPLCRWRGNNLTLDIMPLDEAVLGFSNQWYQSALEAPSQTRLPSGTLLSHIDAPHFLATKLNAFQSRGEGDFLTSADLEDVVVVIDGRPTIRQELQASGALLQSYVAEQLRALLAERHFLEALPGYFLGESHAGQRSRSLMETLRHLARAEQDS